MKIGILSLQGAVGPHLEKLRALGVEGEKVRTPAEMESCQGLILPGGESTTLLKLLHDFSLKSALISFAQQKPVWGVCAGAILMAQRVENPSQECLGLIPISIKRNGYGRQNESFITEVTLTLPGTAPHRQEGVFIRAPQIIEREKSVTIFGEHDGFPVALGFGHHLITTFHPELSPHNALHSHFLTKCQENGRLLTG